MQAITVKYIGPTNTKGSRFKAFCQRGSKTIDYPHEGSHAERHWKAASALIQTFLEQDEKKYKTIINENPWAGPWALGYISGDVAVFVAVRDWNTYKFGE